MPPLTRYAARAAMVYLILGLITGALYWANTMWSLWPPLAALNPIYIHLLVVGWLTQLIFAVIYWMFPIISKSNMRGDPRLANAAFILLNLGLLLRVIFEPWRTLDTTPINGYGLLASALIQTLAGYLIVVVCWPRIRERAGS
jgi:uncharacterized protein DUF2871